MTVTVSQLREELADREAIRDCLFRYCRGIDRCDEEMLRSAYWPDAIDQHLEFTGTREELIAWTMPALRGMDQTMHLIGNVLIRLHGTTASVESYFYGFHRIRDGAAARDTIGSGRYLDIFERRGDEWRIARRTVVTDWFRDYPDSADWARGPFGMKVPPGGRHPDDESYALLTLR
ncbi:MAG TPA: nuclear transport factor 2 family protein [Acetobacteraceae bacterium]|nr:nuclear transport factor 2 family protein [Acetobacteraceae bacterium]